MAQKPALGKGLASLFPGAGKAPSVQAAVSQGQGTGAEAAGPATTVEQNQTLNRDRHPGVALLAIGQIQVNEYQPRRDFNDGTIEELAQSIRENGVIQPLVVRKTPGGYQLIAGERRLRGAKAAGLKQVPVVIRRSSDREALELALIENIQREDLNCVDTALAYFQLVQDFSLTQEEVARRVGKDRASVANHLRLLRLPEEILEDLKTGALSFGHAKALLSLNDSEARMRARSKILEKGMSVRETEQLIDLMKQARESGQKGGSTNEPNPTQSRLKNLAKELTQYWATRVELKGSERRGKIVLHYGSREELERILGAMQNK